jgi:hypothetical protein
VFERQREPARSPSRQQSGRSGEYERPGFQTHRRQLADHPRDVSVRKSGWD